MVRAAAPGGGSTNDVLIPYAIYQQMVANGYTGSRVVDPSQIQQIIAQWTGGGTTQPGGTTGGGTVTVSGSTGGGFSFGGGGFAGLSPSQKANLRASYLEVLHSWGLELNANMKNLVERGVNNEWSTTNFMMHVRSTKYYKQMFAGIQPGMSEAEYLTLFRGYEGRAKDVKMPLSRAAFGTLLKKGVDFAEFDARVTALDRIQRDRALFRQFESVLKQRGELKPKENLRMKDVYDFLRGSGSPQWEKIWEEAAVTTELSRIGFTVGKGNKADLSRKDLLGLIDVVEGRTAGLEVENLGAEFFQGLAQQIQEMLPASRMANFDLTKTDLLELQLGGKRAPQIAQRVQTILKSVEGQKEGAAQVVLPQFQQAPDQRRAQTA